MQKNLLIALGIISGIYTTNSFAETVIYNIEPTHSYVEFHYNHMGYSNQSGKWFANGTVDLDQKDLAKSTANITINIGDINTGIVKLDEHLKGNEFFDVTKFPTATFVSNKVTNKHGKNFDLEGMLTLHGVTKALTLHVTENMLGTNPMTKLSTAGFSATGQFNRSDFAMGKYIPMISDNIKLDIEVEAYIPAPKK